MKKFLFILSIFLFVSCSKDEDSTVKGCTDPQAVNYNINATENDNTCQYSIIGDWTVTKYTLSNGTNILSQFRYIDYTLYDDYSYYQEAGVLNSTDYLIFTGIYSLGGTNNSQLTFTDDDTGITTTCTITSISSSTIKLSYDYDSSTTATLELIKI